jgi:hypothetical protein
MRSPSQLIDHAVLVCFVHFSFCLPTSRPQDLKTSNTSFKRVVSVLAFVVLAIASTANANAEISGNAPALRGDIPKRNLEEMGRKDGYPSTRRQYREDLDCHARD